MGCELDRDVRREYVIRKMRAEGSSKNALKEAMVGYPDPCYFSRVFKEQTNQYPKEYRQSQSET